MGSIFLIISASVAKGEYNPSYGSLVTILEGRLRD